MALPRFFSALPLPRPLAPGSLFDLDEAVARHVQVLRIANGESITLFDGLGGEFTAVIADIGKRTASVAITHFDAIERETPIRITLVQALASADKMDLIVQKAVELGVTEIVPVSTVRATLKLEGERADKRVAHWRAVAVAACEQCGRNRVPVVHGLRTFDQWLASIQNESARIHVLLDPLATATLLGSIDAEKPIALLIGPEGGFAPNEITRAVAYGVVPARFGPRTLRTETAGIAALSALGALFGDLGVGV